jgi:protein involved in polysaccharide export with SLBB domain
VLTKFPISHGLLAGVLGCLLLSLSSAPARADDVQVSQDQIDLLQSLSPEERAALLKQITEGQQGGGEARTTTPQTKPLTGTQTSTRNQQTKTDKLTPPAEPLLRPEDYVVLDLDVVKQDALSGEDREKVEALKARILERNPYRLDRLGALRLPGFEALPLAGLNAREAAKRLQSDRDLRAFGVRVTLLTIERTGDEALKPYGYELFQGGEGTFMPVTDVPVPAEYIVGAGDQLRVQLYGNQNRSFSLTVGRDGRVSFPQLGPIAVGGQRFSEVKASIESRVSRQMIGVRADVAMGDSHAIRVFVLGEVAQPGSYSVNGLATVTSALFASGGITKMGSLRNVQLKRAGAVVRTLDLYDLLLNGDTSNDARLLPGDVVFIPPVGITVSVNGEVRRPAIYEVHEKSTAADLLYLAGGLTPEADPKLTRIERIDNERKRIVVDVNLTAAEGRGLALQSGDFMRVPPVRDVVENSVMVSGFVERPGPFEYRPGLKVTDVLPSIDELRPSADPGYILVRRENATNRAITFRSVDLTRALAAPGSAADLELAPRDRLYVFDREGGRERTLKPLMDEIQAQSRLGEPLLVAGIGGRVKAPGQYPLEDGMRVSDLIRAGGNLDEAAFGGEAELTRYEVVNGEARQTALVKIDLGAVRRGDEAANLLLRPYDYLTIKETPQWRDQETITIAGEVKFPGTYPIQRGETLHAVLLRAGGLTDLAFPAGSVFTRAGLREREAKQIETLANRMQADLAGLALQSAQTNTQAGTQALSVGQSLLADLRATKPVGRLVVNLNTVLHSAPGAQGDIILKNGDQLIIPRSNQEVTVIGEVQNATSHIYKPNLSRDDYISLSGGTTQRADHGHIYVVRADGSVVAGRGGWFRHSTSSVKAGDTIVVPLDAERMRPLPLWSAVTQIIYNIAIAAAAVHSF